MKKYTLVYLLAFVMCLMFMSVQASETGIKVHGHWKFDIYNADGSFDRVVEFENSLLLTGAEALILLLGKDHYVEQWSVILYGSTPQTNDPCIDGAGLPASCWIREVGEPINYPFQFSNLTLFTTTEKLSLKGSMTTPSGLTNPVIGKVSTLLNICHRVSNPACTNVTADIVALFTSKTITPVPLQAGQVVQVTVEMTFS